MDNLQTEVLEIEFLTYSKGMTTISEEDFAKILLRFTNVENINAYLDNVRHCIPDEKVSVKIMAKLILLLFLLVLLLLLYSLSNSVEFLPLI